MAQDSLNKPNTTRSSPTISNNKTDSSKRKAALNAQLRARQRQRKLAADSLRLKLQADSLAKSAAVQTNPFDSGTPQSVDSTLINTIAIVPEVPMLQQSDNPFDILRGGDSLATAGSNMDSVSKTTLPSATMPSLLEPTVYSKNFLFWIFLVALILMAFVVANARSAIANAYAAISSDAALRQIYKEPMGWGSVAYLSLYVLFWLNLAILIFLLLTHFGVVTAYGKLITFLICLGGVSLAYILKHSALYTISKVFPIEKEVRTYNFIILTVGILLGLVLMPINIFIAYAPDSLTQGFIYAAYATLGLAYLVRSLRGLTVASPFLADNKLHFLLYLCTLEFAPLLILIKLILVNT